MTVRAAVVGCGFIGAGAGPLGMGAQSHAAAWSRLEGVRLAGLCDPEPAALRAATELWGVPDGFARVEDMLAAVEPELVSVCTPDATHADVLHRVLAAPSVRAILAEKPLALESRAARGVVRAAEERGVVLAVNYGRRAHPSHRRLRAWLAEGGIGTVRAVTGAYTRGLKHNGTHWLDLARFLVGDIARARGLGPAARGDADATIDVALEFAQGATGLLAGLGDVTYSLFEMDLIGTAGRVRLVEAGHRFETTVVGPSPRFQGHRELLPADGPAGGLDDLVGHAVRDLWGAVREGRPPACGGADALAALELAEAALGTDSAAPRRRAHGREAGV